MELAEEAGFNFQWEFGINLEQDNRDRLVHGNEKCFAHRESIARVDDGARLRPGDERAGESSGRKGTSFCVKLQAEVAQQFYGIHPGFDAAGLMSPQARPGADSAAEHPW